MFCNNLTFCYNNVESMAFVVLIETINVISILRIFGSVTIKYYPREEFIYCALIRCLVDHQNDR